MSIAFVFAGQGSQRPGMGEDFYKNYPIFKDTIEKACANVRQVNDFDLKELSFYGATDRLSDTQYTQPCMVAFAVGISKLLKEKGIAPAFSLGLSLGEYSALYAADVIDEDTVVKLVAKRGMFMKEAAAGMDVKMAAVLMTERETVTDCCKKATDEFKGEKIVSAVNFNCPGQIVISGDSNAVDRACELLKEKGTKRIIELNVSGPFHTQYMKPAGEKLAKEFSGVDFKEGCARMIFNCLGREKEYNEDIPTLLTRQVQSPVYLEDSIRYAYENGADTFVEIGPGNTISKFVKKTVPDAKVLSIDNTEDFENAIKELKV